jgi:hypothetical protein
MVFAVPDALAPDAPVLNPNTVLGEQAGLHDNVAVKQSPGKAVSSTAQTQSESSKFSSAPTVDDEVGKRALIGAGQVREREPRESQTRKEKSSLCDCCFQDAEPKTRRKREKGANPSTQLEFLIEELFRAHDLNQDGLLDEGELIKLNEAVAEVHDANDSEAVRVKFSKLFRDKLDPQGQPVPYSVFRTYILEMLDQIDQHEEAQEMMVEQFIAEARLARTVVTGAPLLVDRPRPRGIYRACLSFCPLSEAGTEMRM